MTSKTITIGELRQQYHLQCNEFFRWISGSAASSILNENVEKIAILRAALREAKILANRSGLEELANEMLGRECVAAALEYEARMWLSLRQELPHDAWEHFVDAEQHIHLAFRTPIGPEVEATYAGRFPAMEKVLFPHMMFMSAGFNHDEGFCTICDQRMSSCLHIKGRIYCYCGQVCAERGFSKFEGDHVAIVTHPIDKRCYIRSYKNKDGKWIDRLSGSQTSVEHQEHTDTDSNTFLVDGIMLSSRLPVGAVL